MNLSMRHRKPKYPYATMNQHRAKAKLRLELNDQSQRSTSGSYNEWCREVAPDWDWTAYHIQNIQWHLDKMTKGQILRMMVNLPPRHSKTETCTIHYAAYRLELNPKTTILIVCHTQGLATKFSRKIRKIVERRVEMSKSRNSAAEWETAAGGGVKAVGVSGIGGGLGFDLVICDDLIKSREVANSPTYRERIKDTYTDDISTRLNPGGAILMPFTRWHLQDIGGQILDSEDGKQWKVLRMPALAEEDDPLRRPVGAALWPDRWPRGYLLERQRVMGPSFHPLYQQNPLLGGSELFDPGCFDNKYVNYVPEGSTFVRYWDKAATEGGMGAESAGVLMARTPDGRFIVCDVEHGRWSPTEREKRMRKLAVVDGSYTTIWTEQEPGSGGKESAQLTIKGLAGYVVRAETVSGKGDKVSRAEPLAIQSNIGNVYLLRDGPNKRWNGTFVAQCMDFPQGSLKDIVDAAAGAFNKLALAGDVGSPVASESRSEVALVANEVMKLYAGFDFSPELI